MTDANIKYSNRQRYVGIKNTQMQNLRVHVKNKNCFSSNILSIKSVEF